MIKAIGERLAELGIHLYRQTYDEDYLLARWWDSLATNGELTGLVASSAYSLSSFLNLFASPNMLVYTVEDLKAEPEILSAHWSEPISTSKSAIFYSSWWQKDMRGTKYQAIVSSTVYEMIFAMEIDTVLGITKQEPLLKLHEKIGYDILGPIPNLFDHSRAWLCVLTANKFFEGKLYKAAKRLLERTNFNIAA